MSVMVTKMNMMISVSGIRRLNINAITNASFVRSLERFDKKLQDWPTRGRVVVGMVKRAPTRL